MARSTKKSASKKSTAIEKKAGTVKKASTGKTAKAQNKTVPSATSVTDFLSSIEHPIRRADGLILLEWFEQITGMPPVMWGGSIVGFGRYHYEYDSGRSGDYLMTGFSPRKSALSIYIMPGYRDLSAHLSKLGKHKFGKSCLYVNKLDDIDLDVLADLVREAVSYLRKGYPTWDQ